MGNAQANARVSDMVYATSTIFDCTLMRREDAVIMVTKEGIEINNITGTVKDRVNRYSLPLETEVTFGRIVRFGYKENEKLCAIIGDSKGNIRFINPSKGTLILKLPCAAMSSIPGEGHAGPITALEKLENDYIATGGVDGSVRIWEVNKGIQERVYMRPDYKNRTGIAPPGVTALCYCPPSALAAYSSSSFSASLAVAYADGQIWVYGVSEGDHSAIVLTTTGSEDNANNNNNNNDRLGSNNNSTNGAGNRGNVLGLINASHPAISLSYLPNEMILGAATGERLLVWNIRFAVRSSQYKNIENNGMYYNSPISPLSSLTINVCRIALFGTYTLAGPWPETPIMLAGCTNGYVSAWALNDTPEFGRCEILPIHGEDGFAIFSGAISVLRNNSAELQSVLAASGNTVVVLAQQSITGGLTGPSLMGSAIVDGKELDYTDLDENGNPIRNPQNIVAPLQKNPLEQEMIAYVDSHPECIDAYLELLRALSYKLHDGKHADSVEGAIDEPNTPAKLLDEASAKLARVFKNFELSLPAADGTKFLNRDKNEIALDNIVKIVQDRVATKGKKHEEEQGVKTSLTHPTVSAATTIAPVVDASSSFLNAVSGTDSVKKIAEAALNIKFTPVPHDNTSYEEIVKAQSENLYVEAMNTAKRLEKRDTKFAKNVDDLCHVNNNTTQDGSEESKDIDPISCLLDETLGLKRLDRTQEYMLNYIKEKHRQELLMHDEKMEKKIEDTKQKFDGERRFWAARFNLALEFHRILRVKAAEICKEAIFNAVIKSLPNGTVSGSRYVTLPLFENPLDFDDKTESKEEPACLLYPAFDLKDRKLVASRLIPAGVVSKANLGKYTYKYLLPCLDISPSYSDNHQEYVITEVPPTMNLLKAYTNSKCLMPAFSEQAAARFVYKIYETFASLIESDSQIVHRDLRPSNIMVRYRGGKQVKLRCSKKSNDDNDTENAQQPQQPQAAVPIADNVKFKKIEPVIFTVGFMRGPKLNDPMELNTVFSAPEVLCGAISKTSDIWSLALVLIKMLQKPACECLEGEYAREKPIFMPVGVAPDALKRWDVARPSEVRYSLLKQIINFCIDIPYNVGEFPKFVAMCFLAPLKLKDSEMVKLMTFLTGKHIEDVDLRFIYQDYQQALAKGETIESFMISSGVAPQPDFINPNIRALLPTNVSDAGLLFITKCLSFFPSRRPTYAQILTFNWFKECGVKLDHELALKASGRHDQNLVTKEGIVIGTHMTIADKADGRI